MRIITIHSSAVVCSIGIERTSSKSCYISKFQYTAMLLFLGEGGSLTCQGQIIWCSNTLTAEDIADMIKL